MLRINFHVVHCLTNDILYQFKTAYPWDYISIVYIGLLKFSEVTFDRRKVNEQLFYLEFHINPSIV